MFFFDAGEVVVNSVGVKGGTTLLNWSEGTSTDTGLHAPLNTKTGKWYGLSYLCFDTSSVTPA